MIFKEYGFDPKKSLSKKDKSFIEDTVKPAIKKGILVLLVEGQEPFTPKTMEDYNSYNNVHRSKGETVLMILKKE
jgi:hypothetical protein